MEQDPYQAPLTESPGASSPYTKPTTKELLFSFDGRIPRRVYWAVSLLAAAIYYGITLPISAISEDLGLILMLVLLIPFFWITLAVYVKRWHDRDKSGWWILIGFIPIIGAIWAFVECGCLRGTIGDNTYGADPT